MKENTYLVGYNKVYVVKMRSTTNNDKNSLGVLSKSYNYAASNGNQIITEKPW